MMLSRVELATAPTPVTHNAPPPRSNTNRPTEVVRQIAMASVNHPEIVPETTSAKPNANLPVPDHGRYIIGEHDSDPVTPGGTGHPGSIASGPADGGRTPVVEIGAPPAPTP